MAGGGVLSLPWSVPLKLSEVDRGPVELRLQPDDAARVRIAAAIGVDSLDRLTAELTARTWLDGAELSGRIDAEVTQTCGISLDAFKTPIRSNFTIRVLPPGSPHAPSDPEELVIDPEGEDPPELLDSETVDVGGYVVEYLLLEVDPFPRKPGAVFEPPEAPAAISPFAKLAELKTRGSGN